MPPLLERLITIRSFIYSLSFVIYIEIFKKPQYDTKKGERKEKDIDMSFSNDAKHRI